MLAKLVFFVYAPWVFFVSVAGTCFRQGHVWYHKSWDHWIRILLSVFMLKEDVVKKCKTSNGFEVRWKTIQKKLTVGSKLVRQDTCAPDGQKKSKQSGSTSELHFKEKKIANFHYINCESSVILYNQVLRLATWRLTQ